MRWVCISWYSRFVTCALVSEDRSLASCLSLIHIYARPAEALVRKYSYGDESMVITKADIPSLGIKAFHSTDVCAAYRRTAYLEVGGFETDVLTNEDMFIAARFLQMCIRDRQ